MANRLHTPGEAGFDGDETTTPGTASRRAPADDFDEDGGTIVDDAAPHAASHEDLASAANPDPLLFPDPEDTLPPGAAQEIQDQIDAEMRKQLSELNTEDDPLPEPLSEPTRP